jgi:DNA-binding winged helix-turn-helix (wHTH) protein/tetratricopeptide (TPR) repeat protein
MMESVSSASARPVPQEYVFDDVVIDVGRHQVWLRGRLLPLSKLTFDLLLLLVRQAPNMVSHEEAAMRVWGPRRVVTPETLTQAVLRLRHRLGDNAARPRYIESIRGEGYRLLPVVRANCPPRAQQMTPAKRVLAIGMTVVVMLAAGFVLSRLHSSDASPAAAGAGTEHSMSQLSEIDVDNALTTSHEALAFYMRAVALLDEDTDGNAVLAQKYLDEALRLDPGFASAYGFKALIHAYALDFAVGSGEYAPTAIADRARLVHENVERALLLNADTDVAYWALGIAHMHSWRWSAARAAFARAIELSPNQSTFRAKFGWFRVCALGENDGISEIRRALELDSQNPFAHELMGRTLLCLGDRPAAYAALQKAVEIEPISLRRRVLRAYLGAGVVADSVAARQLADIEPLLSEVRPQTLALMAVAYSAVGQLGYARQLFDQVLVRNEQHHVRPGPRIYGYLAIGENQRALALLEETVENLGPGFGFLSLIDIKWNVSAIPALDEPRFVALRERLRSLD